MFEIAHEVNKEGSEVYDNANTLQKAFDEELKKLSDTLDIEY